MAMTNPTDATEVLYGASGDVRDEFNAYVAATTAGHYADELELPGALVIASLRRATRLINSFLEPVYADQIPFTATADVPRLLDEIGTDLAIFYALRATSTKMAPVTNDKKRDYYDAYIAEDPPGILPQLRDRKLQLPELTAGYADDVKAVRAQGRAPIFDVDATPNHAVDPHLLDDIATERDA